MHRPEALLSGVKIFGSVSGDILHDIPENLLLGVTCRSNKRLVAGTILAPALEFLLILLTLLLGCWLYVLPYIHPPTISQPPSSEIVDSDFCLFVVYLKPQMVFCAFLFFPHCFLGL